ncbi:LysR substrate-binding domain-containing protein [Salinarimonas ramus]|uniref:LysR family transcriptional regulator n=1 Tax=Salinarimonas ramus TaxID=690164 RepID=A0A917QB76_9HYPH|nr:LysR substrate-binding domain-containing protein [Salinarimonas ramus]GGK40423.1 LysR family transcriptional regulator [Salinarimonas ramus]
MRNLSRVHLGGLRAVEAAARLGTLRAAAEELGVTVGAVSQQILKCEAELGRTLFERRPRGLEPTPLGAAVIARLAVGFAEISAAVALADQRREDVLTVSVAPVLASKWLVWRLDRFTRANPGIRVRIDAALELVDPNVSDVDVCIRVGRGPYPGVRAEPLVAQLVFPVCAPAVAERLRTPADLAHVPIVSEPAAMFSWDVWLRPNGLDRSMLGEGPVYSDAALCFDAAIAGQGVFLAWETLAADALAMGRLVAPFPDRYATGISYWFVTARDRAPTRAVRAFHDFIAAALRESCPGGAAAIAAASSRA